MWTREILKSNAKLALKDRYWIAILASLIVGLLSGGTPGFGGLSYRKNFKMNSSGVSGVKEFFSQNSQIIFPIIAFAAFVGSMIICAAIVYKIFIANPLRMGQDRFYLQNRYGKADIITLFSAFKPGYMNVVKVIFVKDLYICLWSLLFIVPGIIKSIEYMAVEYILAENPNMELKRTLELSGQMTAGEKWNIFVLGLSFFGWLLLCGVTCGIGYLFLAPYMQATFAELYTALREKVLVQNMAAAYELPGVAGV